MLIFFVKSAKVEIKSQSNNLVFFLWTENQNGFRVHWNSSIDVHINYEINVWIKL